MLYQVCKSGWKKTRDDQLCTETTAMIEAALKKKENRKKEGFNTAARFLLSQIVSMEANSRVTAAIGGSRRSYFVQGLPHCEICVSVFFHLLDDH